MEILKSGKSGLSQTNLEDISYSLNIVKFFQEPACAVMKHVNPSGFAVGGTEHNSSLRSVYVRARDCDARAAFGSVIAFNVEVDAETAREIMGTFVECVVAPAFSNDALACFNDSETYKLNRHVRILRCGDLRSIPRYTDDPVEPKHYTIKVLCDGSFVVAAPLLTAMKTTADLKIAEAKIRDGAAVRSTVPTSEERKRDLLSSWYVNLNVRSNGVVILKNGQTLAVGTGEQDRVGAVEQAIAKYRAKYQGTETIEDSVMASDGFFPFPDAVEVAAEAGIRVIAAPAGSMRDADVIQRANELGVSLFHASERIFSHH
jgi:phosphoribosylaminoimidazolecarboxamide formyltransferase/IMP cyclohydrolase